MIDDWEEEEERRICVDIDMRGARVRGYEANRLLELSRFVDCYEVMENMQRTNAPDRPSYVLVHSSKG